MHTIQLDLAEVRYLSSAGIGVLLRFHRELARIDGSMRVSNPSPMVRKVLEISGLAKTFLLDSPEASEPEAAPPSVRSWSGMGFATRFTRKVPASPSNVESSATPCAWPVVGLSKRTVKG